MIYRDVLYCVKSGPYFPEFGLNISPYPVSMWENTDQKDSEYGHILPSIKGRFYSDQYCPSLNNINAKLR